MSDPPLATDLAAAPVEGHSRWKLAGKVGMVVVTAVSLHLLGPTLAAVYTSLGDVVHLKPWWLLVIVASQCAAFVCLWWLMRQLMDSVSWKAVARAHLVGNAMSHVIPGGAATGAAVQIRMLVRSGVDRATALSAMPVVGLLTTAALFISPVFALPAVIAIPDLPRELVWAAVLGVVGAALLAGALYVFLMTTRPLVAVAEAIESLGNKLWNRKEPTTGLADKLLHERDIIRARLGDRKATAVAAAAGNVGFDFLALLAALAAVGAEPNPELVLLAFVTVELLGMLPFTPGGLGVVEGGLIATLTIAGIAAADAAVATAAYRAVSFLLPILAGAVAYIWFRLERPARD